MKHPSKPSGLTIGVTIELGILATPSRYGWRVEHGGFFCCRYCRSRSPSSRAPAPPPPGPPTRPSVPPVLAAFAASAARGGAAVTDCGPATAAAAATSTGIAAGTPVPPSLVPPAVP